MTGPEICGVCWALKFLRAVGARSGHAGQRAVPHDGQQVALQHFVCAVSGGAGGICFVFICCCDLEVSFFVLVGLLRLPPSFPPCTQPGCFHPLSEYFLLPT